MAGGKFQPGQSGNPNGRPKIPAEVKAMARAATEKALNRAIALIDSQDENVSLKAVGIVLDRAWGKPVQPVDGDGEGGPIQLDLGSTDLARRLAFLLTRGVQAPASKD